MSYRDRLPFLHLTKSDALKGWCVWIRPVLFFVFMWMSQKYILSAWHFDSPTQTLHLCAKTATLRTQADVPTHQVDKTSHDSSKVMTHETHYLKKGVGYRRPPLIVRIAQLKRGGLDKPSPPLLICLWQSKNVTNDFIWRILNYWSLITSRRLQFIIVKWKIMHHLTQSTSHHHRSFEMYHLKGRLLFRFKCRS